MTFRNLTCFLGKIKMDRLQNGLKKGLKLLKNSTDKYDNIKLYAIDLSRSPVGKFSCAQIVWGYTLLNGNWISETEQSSLQATTFNQFLLSVQVFVACDLLWSIIRLSETEESSLQATIAH